jgi:hypothetical protein
MIKKALLIGVNEYQDAVGLPSLKFAEADAVSLATVLHKKCAFETQTLLGAEATRDAIESSLMSAGDGDLHLFFFAGHGQRIRGQYRLHTVDSNVSGLRSISFEDLSSYWHESFGFPRVLVMIDACRNEAHGIRGHRGLDGQTLRDIGRLAQADRWIEVLYGCSEGQVSYEDEALKHGVFTRALLDVIENASGRLSTDTLSGAAADKMRQWSASDPFGRKQEAYRYSRPSLTEKIELIAGEEAIPQENEIETTGRVPSLEEFKVLCWETRRWRPHPVTKMSCAQESDHFEITNSSFIHKHAMLVADNVLISDFDATLRLSGEYNGIHFIADSGHDHIIACQPHKQGVDTNLPHDIIVRRNSGEISFFREDGSQMYKNISHGKEDMSGFLGLSMNNEQTVRIYRWDMIRRS